MKQANFRVANRESGTTWFAAKALAFASLCAFGMQPMVASAQANLPISVQQGNGATLGTSSNGTSVVNIAAPNRAGVSNNMFGQYNVGTSGIVLNNSGQTVQTQIGGTVQGNAALGSGNANLIVMQATGGSATRMLGATEVAGKGANVVVANPAGITCSGCSFLNAPRVTLTTGTPVMDQDGSLSGIYVQNGEITIDGKGLNAKDSAVDLISRAMTINGAVQGKSIDAIAGVNQVDYATKSVRAVNGSYSGAEVAIDVQALGSMYGDGAVRLIANEAGVGVRDNGKISSLNGDISISSKGDITIGAPGQISSASSVALNGVNVRNDGKLASDSMRVEAARNVDNSGSVEGRNVTITAGDTLTSSGKLDASNGLFLIGSRKANLDGGSATSSGRLYVSGNTVTNREGKMSAAGELAIDATTVDNTKGSIKSNDVVNVDAKTLLNDGGEIAGAKGTNLPGQSGQQPTPDQGGQQPAPDQGGQQPAPDQGSTPVEPQTGDMGTLITPGGEMPMSMYELGRLPDLVNVGGNRFVPRQFLAMLGYEDKGGAAPVNPTPVEPTPTPVNPTPVEPTPTPVNPTPVEPAPAPVNPVPDHSYHTVDPNEGPMGTLITPGGEMPLSMYELGRLPDLVDLGGNRFVPRQFLTMLGYDDKGNRVR